MQEEFEGKRKKQKNKEKSLGLVQSVRFSDSEEDSKLLEDLSESARKNTRTISSEIKHILKFYFGMDNERMDKLIEMWNKGIYHQAEE